MGLPDTVVGVLVLVLAFLPGIPGDFVYRTFVGVSWRERDLNRLGRIISFSVAGLLLYAFLAAGLGLPPADHVTPQTFTAASFSASDIPTLGVSYFGHLMGSGVAGVFGAFGLHAIARISPHTNPRDSWDELIHSTVSGRWVLVALTNGDAYLAQIAHADVSAAPEHRDLILQEPYRWDAEAKNYLPTRQQHLFVRGSDLASIATVFDAMKDTEQRLIPVDNTPFSND